MLFRTAVLCAIVTLLPFAHALAVPRAPSMYSFNLHIGHLLTAAGKMTMLLSWTVAEMAITVAPGTVAEAVTVDACK
jgi:hypothetical protein